MTDEEFENIVAEGIDALPAWVHKKMDNLIIVAEDEPSAEQLEEMKASGEVLFGLYEGTPLVHRDHGHFGLPDKITIFKRPILETYAKPEDIRACVHNTVWHEVAHHFGLDDDELEREEVKRGKTM